MTDRLRSEIIEAKRKHAELVRRYGRKPMKRPPLGSYERFWILSQGTAMDREMLRQLDKEHDEKCLNQS